MASSLTLRAASRPCLLPAVVGGESLAQVPRLDLVKERIDAKDLGLLAQRLLARLEFGEMDCEEVAVVCTLVTWPRDERAQDAWVHFANITDEKDLIEQGVFEGLKSKTFCARNWCERPNLRKR